MFLTIIFVSAINVHAENIVSGSHLPPMPEPMKKPSTLFILCQVLLPCVPFPASAIDYYIGLKGGLGLSDFWGTGNIDSAGMKSTMNAGFFGGGLFSAQFNDYVGAQFECMYAMKGKLIDGDYPSISIEKVWNINYIEMPLILKLSLPIKNARPLVYAGPSFAFPVSSSYRIITQQETSIPGEYKSTDTTIDLKSSTAGFDVGLVIGGGMDFFIESGVIIFDIRYTLGFLSWNNEPGKDIRNSLVSFIIGYAYKF
jgi:hypothetical protein